MRIRAITYFCNPGGALDEKVLQQAGTFLAEAKEAYEQAGYEVQTTRLATVPFPQMIKKISDTPAFARKLSEILPQVGIAYAALGPALPERMESYAVIPEAIAAAENIFFSGIMAEPRHGISLDAVRACAEVIFRTAPLEANGFANLNFAALANVRPGSPFFPAAYHEGNEPAFALATEAADLAVEAFTRAKDIPSGRETLVNSLETHARQLVKTADLLKYKYHTRFCGIDLSLAPFPEEMRSIGTAIERMGVPAVGSHGSLTANAILTEAIARARFPRTGFNGVLLPVLEDAILANRAAEGRLGIKDILLLSAVCGTGLDTIPLPGDTSIEALNPLLLDLSTLAMRLDKPLTARLMPIPGKKAGDLTTFDFGFFANSRVMALDSLLLAGALHGHGSFTLHSYHEEDHND